MGYALAYTYVHIYKYIYVLKEIKTCIKYMSIPGGFLSLEI